MFNPSSVVIEAFVDELIEHYVNMYGENESDIQLIAINARNALEIIANSDAPYHDVNHTIMVTNVGTEILRGKVLIEGHAFPSDHFACESQIRQRGFDPAESLVTVAPRPGEETLRADDLLAAPGPWRPCWASSAT